MPEDKFLSELKAAGEHMDGTDPEGAIARLKEALTWIPDEGPSFDNDALESDTHRHMDLIEQNEDALLMPEPIPEATLDETFADELLPEVIVRAPELLINGSFRIDQRLCSINTVVADNTYGPDRWLILAEGNGPKCLTYNVFDPGGSGAPAKAVDANGKLQVTCQEDSKKYGLMQIIEAQNLQHVTEALTFQVALTGSGNQTWKLLLCKWNGIGDYRNGADPISAWGGSGVTPTLGTSWATASDVVSCAVTTTKTTFTVAMTEAVDGSTYSNYAVLVWRDDNATATNDTTVFRRASLHQGDVWDVLYPIDKTQELAQCQRYYQKTYNQNVVPGTAGYQRGSHEGAIVGPTGEFIITWDFAVTMRQHYVIPGTVVVYSTDGSTLSVRDITAGANIAISASFTTRGVGVLPSGALDAGNSGHLVVCDITAESEL